MAFDHTRSLDSSVSSTAAVEETPSSDLTLTEKETEFPQDPR